MDKFQFIPYFKEVAEKHPNLLHVDATPAFFRISGLQAMEEMLSAGTYAKEVVLCAEDANDGRFFHDNADYYCALPNYSFYILRRTKVGDEADRQLSLDESMRIALEIFARLDIHSREELYGLRDFDWNSVNHYGVGPIAQNYWGTRFSFTLDTPLNLPTYTPANWGE